MFLKNLKIEKNGELLRDIPFHKGVNLIVDETKTADKKESGNNLGKTTILRLIDFCLGGDGINIYQDLEFKNKHNTEIEKFLKDNNVLITLILKEDIEDEQSEEIVIRRNFLNRGSKIQEIDGAQYNEEDFQKKLKELIFKSRSDKPTFRQIIAKNIRDERNRLNNTVKVLNAFASSEVYESLYLFWLGIELDVNARKQQLLREKTIENSLQNRLKREYSFSQIEQSLLVIYRNIKELESKKNSYNLNENYRKQIAQLNDSKFAINQLSTELSRLEFRKSLIIESKTDLVKESATIDTTQLKQLYEEANALIPNLNKSFSETLNFHNKMVEEKINFITNELPSLEVTIAEIKKKIEIFLIQERELTVSLKKLGAFEGLESIITELSSEYEKKGHFEESKKMWKASIEKLKNISSELEAINNGIRSKDSLIQESASEFNKYFSELSYQLYGERYILSADIGDKGYELNISSISGNPGTGKKKGQIAAFDLAYIQFAEAKNIPCLHFILHDQIENVHDNQINLLVEIVGKVNCQYVLPILRDKLPSNINVKQYEIISLSQSDKLFKV